jgi:hypothetical protein
MDATWNAAFVAHGHDISPHSKFKEATVWTSCVDTHHDEQNIILAPRDAGLAAWRVLCGAILVQALLFNRLSQQSQIAYCSSLSSHTS